MADATSIDKFNMKPSSFAKRKSRRRLRGVAAKNWAWLQGMTRKHPDEIVIRLHDEYDSYFDGAYPNKWVAMDHERNSEFVGDSMMKLFLRSSILREVREMMLTK